MYLRSVWDNAEIWWSEWSRIQRPDLVDNYFILLVTPLLMSTSLWYIWLFVGLNLLYKLNYI